MKLLQVIRSLQRSLAKALKQTCLNAKGINKIAKITVSNEQNQMKYEKVCKKESNNNILNMKYIVTKNVLKAQSEISSSGNISQNTE